ncbi:hypothetical protein [Bifidobacterium thermophilum]|uniref:Uncharacterized protein n=1 Tax=Bifidobacterium thermophilum TaxID=33905 RepID=A0A7X9NPI3_9BIFI|nr:hypothetical protein [Bifidobacterium thermophilum]NME61435.1 hypothetical protein [Bifidobacterium thermophilum]
MALMVFDADGADDVMTDGVAGAGGWPTTLADGALMVPVRWLTTLTDHVGR